MCKFLLSEKADVNAARSGDAMTQLCMAAMRGQVHAMQVLLEHGADRDQPNHRGHTPLRYAAQFGHVDAAEVLLHAGCRVDRANAQGYFQRAVASDPLQAASYFELEALYRDAGASPSALEVLDRLEIAR